MARTAITMMILPSTFPAIDPAAELGLGDGVGIIGNSSGVGVGCEVLDGSSATV